MSSNLVGNHSRDKQIDFVITRMITERIGLHSVLLPLLIIKITISSIVIGLKNSYFPLIHLPSCYRTVSYRTVQKANHIQSSILNQPITTLVSITIVTVYVHTPELGLSSKWRFFSLEQ